MSPCALGAWVVLRPRRRRSLTGPAALAAVGFVVLALAAGAASPAGAAAAAAVSQAVDQPAADPTVETPAVTVSPAPGAPAQVARYDPVDDPEIAAT